jgi:ribosomal protein S20
MPITSSAKKALRRDKRRQKVNYKTRANTKKAIDTIKRGSNDPKDMSRLQSTLDRAAKEKIFHPKKVSRLKSRLNKLVKSRIEKPTDAKPKTKKASPKKVSAKKTTKK